MIDGGCSYIAQNPNSIWQTEMLTVARLSPNADEIAFGTYGGSKEKILRQPAKKYKKTALKLSLILYNDLD